MQEAFTGSFMNGPDIDLVNWPGLELSDDEHDRLWGNHNVISLLDLCPSARVETEKGPDIPTVSDVYYTVYSEDIERLRQELATEVRSIIGRAASTP